MQPSKQPSVAGFTLIGLLVSVSIAAILVSIATNAVASWTNKASIGIAGIRLVDSINSARSLALVRESDVVLCPSENGRTCSKGTHWENGWIGFGDLRENGERDEGEPILIRQEALGGNIHLLSTTGRSRLRFQPTGSNGGSNVTFTACASAMSMSWIMSNSGNLRSAPASAAAAAACK